DEEGEIGDYDDARPLAYEVDAGRLLFDNTARYDEDNAWVRMPVAVPLQFRRSDGGGEPQAHVTFLPGARPAPASALSAGRDDGGGRFVEFTWHTWLWFELQTDAGGRLRVDGNEKTVLLCLDLAPGCEREPVDVVRCRLRLADDAGDSWEGASYFTPEFF